MRKVFLLSLLMVVFMTTSAFSWKALRIDSTNYRVMLKENKIWLEDNAWKTPTDNPRLYLEDTNPAFFALVFNTLKDFVFNGGSEYKEVFIWYESYTSKATGQTYNIIRQIQAR